MKRCHVSTQDTLITGGRVWRLRRELNWWQVLSWLVSSHETGSSHRTWLGSSLGKWKCSWCSLTTVCCRQRHSFTWDCTMFDLPNFCSQGKNLVTDSMKIVSIIADAVLAIKVPDEEMTSIKTTELALTLGRHTPAKLARLTIEGGDGRFVLPVEKETLESSISGTSFVDTQVYFHVPSLFSQPNLVMLVKSLRTSGHIFVRHRIPPHPPPPPPPYFPNSNNRELKSRCFWATDGNQNFNFSLFGAFWRHRVCNV